MAAFDFPSSPNNGDTYSANGIDWIYNGNVWKKDATAGVKGQKGEIGVGDKGCLLYTSPSPRDATLSRMPSSA